MFVADLNERISVFGPNGGFVHAFGWDVIPGNVETGFEVCTVATGCKAATMGGEEGQLSFASAIALDGAGNLYVSDSGNHRISVFDTTGPQFLRAFGWDVLPGNLDPEFEVCSANCKTGTSGGGPGQLASPQGVALDSGGTLYVADTFNDRISVFATGAPPSFLRAFGWDVAPGNLEPEFEVCGGSCKAGVGGGGSGQLDGPRGLALDGAGQLHVADRENHRMSVFTLGPPPAFSRAFGADVLPGNLEPGFEVCSTNCKIGVNDDDFGELGFPQGPAVDGSGNVWVGEWENDRVSVFDVGPPTTFVNALGWDVIPGDPTNEFELCTENTGCQAGNSAGGAGAVAKPQAIVFDCRGAAWVADTLNDRIQRFGEPGTPAAPCPETAVSPITASRADTPSNEFELGKLRRKKNKGIAILFATFPGPGEFALEGRAIQGIPGEGLARSSRFTAGGREMLKIKPAKRGKRARSLRRRLETRGRARVKLRVTYVPSGGIAGARTRRVKLVKR